MDGAYDTRACHNAVANRAAHAVIPTRRNAKPWKPPVVVCGQTTAGQWTTAGAEARNEILRATKYLGRAIWRKWSGYHRKSRVETTLSWIAGNPLPGSECIVSNYWATESLSLIAMQSTAGQRMAREFDRQVAELQIRAAVLNRFTALGIPKTVLPSCWRQNVKHWQGLDYAAISAV